MDSREGYYWSTVKFGANQWGAMMSNGKIKVTVDERYFTHYRVTMVDAMGKIYGVAGDVAVKAKAMRDNCCKDDSYSITVKGKWVTGATHFAVHPYDNANSFALPVS